MAALASIDLDAARIPPTPHSEAGSERTGRIVVHPDRVDSALGGPNAWHLTARQLKKLAVRPIGWEASQSASTATDNANDAEHKKTEAAA